MCDEALLLQLPPVAFEMLMRYIHRDLEKPAFRRKLQTLQSPKLSKNLMSLAKQFRQEGRQEGLKFSKQQDILETLENRF